MTRLRILFVVAVVGVALGCGINSVSKRQLGAVKAGDVLTYRYQKGGKSWFYADKVTRVEGDKIYYNPSSNESTKRKNRPASGRNWRRTQQHSPRRKKTIGSR